MDTNNKRKTPALKLLSDDNSKSSFIKIESIVNKAFGDNITNNKKLFDFFKQGSVQQRIGHVKDEYNKLAA